MSSHIQPFEILSCTWPFPVSEKSFDPEWQAQLTHLKPTPEWKPNGENLFWTTNWSGLFRGGDKFLGTMRQFGVAFRIRVNATGKLVFTCRGRCVVRRGDSTAFEGVPASYACIDVETGDLLDVAVADGPDDWSWGANIEPVASGGAELINTYLPHVEARLREPNGPPMKIFTDARDPIRTVISIYSMILNGYSPSKVYIFGSYQWKPFARHLLAQFLPFANVVPLPRLRDQIWQAASPHLADVAKNLPMVMKACITLLCDPLEFCMMDDDIFVLRTVADAQALFRENNFVFVPEIDNAAIYRPIWSDVFGDISLAQTSRQNGSLCWMRMQKDRKAIANIMLRGLEKLEGLPDVWSAWSWEQGLTAYLFADDATAELPAQRYWYPFFCGLPGGMLGYDYANNPCRFTTIHFGGNVPKPNDSDALQLMPQLLGRDSQRFAQDVTPLE